MTPPYDCAPTDLFRCANHARMASAYVETGLTPRVVSAIRQFERETGAPCMVHAATAVRSNLINGMIRHRQAATHFKSDRARRLHHVSEALRIRSILCVGKVFYSPPRYRTCPGFMSIHTGV